MKKLLVILLPVILIMPSIAGARAFPQDAAHSSKGVFTGGPPNLDWERHDVGLIRLVVTNMGVLGAGGEAGLPEGMLHCEYPPGSGEDHLYGCGVWIGAIVSDTPYVSTGWEGWAGPWYEFYPSDADWDTIWVASVPETLHGLPYRDPYIPVSQQDFICKYSDDFKTDILYHHPLHIEIIQKTYAWGYSILDDFIYADYLIISKHEVDTLKDAFVGFFVDGDVGYIAGGAHIWEDDFTWFDSTTMMAVIEDAPGGDDGDAISPFGVRIVQAPGKLEELKLSFHWYRGEDSPSPDSVRYRYLSDGVIMRDQLASEAMDTRFLFGFGPFEIAPKETLPLTVAFVCGKGREGLLKNAAIAQELYLNNFVTPAPPPAPSLKVYPGNHRVRLDWRPVIGETNPEEYTDPNREDGVEKPFEGYRVYKSVSGLGGPWTLLAEYDKVNNFGYNTGLQYEYVDSGLVNGINYYYAVTAFALPDTVFGAPWLESGISATAKRVCPGTTPKPIGMVAVVPNPYLGDIDYTEGLPWEYPLEEGRPWTEECRRIQFINLPPKCTIRIYTLAGDLVDTIEHDDPTKGYHDWHLTSHVHQAIGSDIYIFTVEDKETGEIQVGNFVIIK